MLRHALAHHGQVARTAACNACRHSDQRLARSLLLAHERARTDEFRTTHEFAGAMLGVRAEITIAAGQLQRAGFIRYKRGCIEVADRHGSESAACECHGIVRRACGALLGPPAGSKGVYRR
ncbi:MAG: Crp/Fnr family transcriptional regulator [Acetobacteraceae bacterium]|nr:Crp/Fnr family transcriptional regulator [Acetobacteraceae bacterium]